MFVALPTHISSFVQFVEIIEQLEHNKAQLTQLSEDPSSNFPFIINIQVYLIPTAQEHKGTPTAPVPVPWSPLQV